MRDKVRGEGGFALVEVLASLVVVGLMSLMIIAGIEASRGVWARIEAREASGEVIDAAQESLRNRIEQTFPTTLYVASPQTVDFIGGRETLVFTANPPDSERPSPLRRYSLSVDAAGEMVLSSVSDVDPRVKAGATRQVLLDRVRALNIAYFGAASPDFQRRWRPTWTQQQSAPELVRIGVTFEPGDPRFWPDLIVRPRATIDSLCVINTYTHHCQGRGA